MKIARNHIRHVKRSLRNIILRLQHRLSMTRAEFMSIIVASGLLLLGYVVDMAAHWYSGIPSGRYAREDSLFFQLAAAADTSGGDQKPAPPVDVSQLPLNPWPQIEKAAKSDSEVVRLVDKGGTDRIDINLATREQLMRLPGIGPALADRIVLFRDVHGPFDRVEDLQQVSGIGPARVARLSDVATARRTPNRP